MLIPESRSEKEEAYLARFRVWVKTLPEEDQARFCQHGNYVGFKAALSFMCKECSGE